MHHIISTTRTSALFFFNNSTPRLRLRARTDTGGRKCYRSYRNASPPLHRMPADYTVATAPRVQCNRLLPAPTLSNLRSADSSADSADKMLWCIHRILR